MPRRLTERQVTVLAAIERLGKPTIPQLTRELPGLTPSAVWRVVESLDEKGKVSVRGDERWKYLGTPGDWPTHHPSWMDELQPHEFVRVSSTDLSSAWPKRGS